MLQLRKLTCHISVRKNEDFFSYKLLCILINAASYMAFKICALLATAQKTYQEMISVWQPHKNTCVCYECE